MDFPSCGLVLLSVIAEVILSRAELVKLTFVPLLSPNNVSNSGAPQGNADVEIKQFERSYTTGSDRSWHLPAKLLGLHKSNPITH